VKSLSVTGPDDRVFVQHSLFNCHRPDSEWISQTSLACFHDTEPFSGAPVFIPISHDPEKNHYVAFGVFCSASCAKAYLVSRPSYKNAQAILYLSQMIRSCFGITSAVTAAPPAYTLEKFGGSLSLQAFRSQNARGVEMICTPTVTLRVMVFEERPVDEKGEELVPNAGVPIGAMKTSSGARWEVRGLQIPKEKQASSIELTGGMQQYATKSLYSEFLEKKGEKVDGDDVFTKDVKPQKKARSKRQKLDSHDKIGQSGLAAFIKKKKT
jgi:hypothetical protein